MKVRREVPKFNKDGSRAKKDAVQYQCSTCGQWTKSTAVSVDHIAPVIAVETGFSDWNDFVSRLFCGPENLQVICDPCHNAKTQTERIARLTLQYTEELYRFEMALMQGIIPADWKKTLTRYIAKKKTKGLEDVVQRAQTIKENLERELGHVNKLKKSSK
jgi:ribosomal protein L44E